MKKDLTNKNIANNLFEEVSKNRAKILDDFCKAYVASRWQDYFSKKGKIEIGRLELVEWRKSPTETIYSFRLKRGKLKWCQIQRLLCHQKS